MHVAHMPTLSLVRVCTLQNVRLEAGLGSLREKRWSTVQVSLGTARTYGYQFGSIQRLAGRR